MNLVNPSHATKINRLDSGLSISLRSPALKTGYSNSFRKTSKKSLEKNPP